MQSLCAASLVFLACIVDRVSTGVMSFFLNFTFVSGISLFAASEIFRKGVKNAVNMRRNARFGLAL